jgi:GntR family transcriptional repressor for pyruvate dehydrogenase complex
VSDPLPIQPRSVLPPQRESGSLVQNAIATVTDHIRTSRLKVGDTLPGEAHFAAELGVSRAVMREAFGALAALKLIDVGNGRKPRVAAIDGSVIAASLDHAVNTAQITVPEVWDVRRTIERRTAALAAERRTEAEAAEIMELSDAMGRDGRSLDELTRLDINFHQAIVRASHNALFVQIFTSFAQLMEVAVPAAWDTFVTEDQLASNLERHRMLARAIRDRDVAGALTAIDEHFHTTIDEVLQRTLA